MAKGQPFNIRLEKATELMVLQEARRSNRSKSAVVEELTEEAARMRRFPGIGFRTNSAHRDAWVVGSGLDVWEIVEMVEASGSAEAVISDSHLNEAQVRLACAYRDSFPDEIQQALSDNRRPADELRSLYPLISWPSA